MKLLKFESYDEYKSAQVEANKLKFSKVFAEDDELSRIATHFAEGVPGGRKGVCHGVRNGYEVRFLRERLPGLDLIGTDISATAADIPNCMVWDMHDARAEWVGALDFVYSNSWDHTYDPDKLFSTWADSLSDKGLLYLAYTNLHSDGGVTDQSKYDAFGCSLDELMGILRQYFRLVDVLEINERLTTKAVKKKIRMALKGRLEQLFAKPTSSKHIHVLVFCKRAASGESGIGV